MSKSKKVVDSTEEYSKLKNELDANIQKLVSVSSEMKTLVSGIFTEVSGESELDKIKNELMKNYDKMSSLEASYRTK